MATENYNPDDFDWGNDTQGINLDDVGPNVYEDAIRAALNAHEVKYGWKYLTKTERREGKGRLFRSTNYMPREGREFFEENFPGYTFVWDTALGHHDHPVSHLATELNELEMVEPFTTSGEQYISLFGNEKRNVRYKRNCLTVYTKKTPKEYIRYQNVGPTAVLHDMEKLCDPTTSIGKLDNIVIPHSLYYMSMSEIGRILAVRPSRKISALIHRHKETHGFLNAGEQEYWVDQKMVVTQVNVSTGEKYVHPSLEALFHQGSARTSYGGVAWTIRAAGGDSFFVDMVGCPNEICEAYTPLRYIKPESWEEYTYSNISVKKFLHWTWMTASVSTGKVVLEDCDLFSKLRRYVAGKQRSPRLKTETVNLARRLCNKADIISIHGGGAHDIPVASMTDYVEVAFYIDQRSELDAALSFHRDNVKITEALNKYYEDGSVPKDFTLITQAAMKSGKTFSDAAIRVINTVRDAQFMTADEYVKLNLPQNDAALVLLHESDPGGQVPGPWW